MSFYQDVTIAGFGGQGVLLIGNLLAYASMNKGLQVTYMPVYGVEMRGGTANCTVVISDQDIGSPLIHKPKSIIVMNQPSLEKFQPRLLDNGVQIVNSSIVSPELIEKKRVHSFAVPANSIADQLGSLRMANMVALGAWVEATKSILLEDVKSSLKDVVSSNNVGLIPKNKEAIQAGAEYVQKNL